MIKKILLQKKSLLMMAAAAAAVVIGIVCLAPGGVGAGYGISGPAAHSGAAGPKSAVLHDWNTPLSSGSGGPDSGYEYEPGEEAYTDTDAGAAASDSAAGTAATASDPYADTYTQESGSSGDWTSDGGGTVGGNGNENGQPAQQSSAATLSIDADTLGLGYIMAPRTVYFNEGETVFDVLYRECRASGIHMSSRWTPIYNSAYIEGINNIYEFDGGELSGWMYMVNGWYPNYGCSQYYLKDGDVIAWRYTCDLGRDIGGEFVVQG